MSYIQPGVVVSPTARLQLVRVIIDRGPEGVAYGLANWDRTACIVFRWNGSDDRPIGNPQSRGLPTWVVLDKELYVAVVDQLLDGQSELQSFARTFLGM